MKLLKFIVLIFVFLTFTSCDYYHSFNFNNNSTHDVYLLLGVIEGDFNRGLYPDTVIRGNMWMCGPINQGESKYYVYSEAIKDPWTNTVCLFILDADTIKSYSWEEIQDGYKVLQRYDISPENIKALKYKIPYPPSEAMKNMKMYPPYGE
jgi:hypothetical protein